MQGFLGGLVTGGFASVLALFVVSVVSEQPAGPTPPAPPLVNAPQVEDAPQPAEEDASSPVGSVTVDEPVAPALPEGETTPADATSPAAQAPDTQAPAADTAPLDAPDVVAIEGAMEAPVVGEGAGLGIDPVDPVLPNPQSLPPQVPANEADLTVSTAPAATVLVQEPEEAADVAGVTDTTDPMPSTGPAAGEDSEAEGADEMFILDVPQTDVPQQTDNGTDAPAAPAPATDDPVLADDPMLASPDEPVAPRIQLQGQGNTLLTDRDTGVTVRRPSSETDLGSAPQAGPDGEANADAAAPVNALMEFAATAPDTGGKPLMSVVLIDDGSMAAAAAALSGIPFPVTIALDAARPDAAAAMAAYRADGFEVAVLADLPEGAQPQDVEVTFQSVFSALPEAIAVIDMGQGGLQSDREVTAQAMGILADQGRGFLTVSQGLNMAGRAAEQSGVPAATVYRDLDANGQDARVIRRFVDQAAFRARQQSGVVLVGRVRPDTISALILWGTANVDDQVALVPLSTVLTAQE